MSESETLTGNPLRVCVLFGGRSSEHEVSLQSAQNVMQALREAGHTVVPVGITRSGRWLTGDDPMEQLQAVGRQELAAGGGDGSARPLQHRSEPWALMPTARPGGNGAALDVVFPVLHGPYGEDGTVQGLLEMANIPYVGCGVLASAVGMDKALCKRVFAAAGLRQVPYQEVLRRRWRQEPEPLLDHLMGELAFPLFVKPANLGSSIGISKAHTRPQLAVAMETASQYDGKIVVEQAVPNAREIEVSVLGNDDPVASVPGEIVPGNEFYDYDAKYMNDNSRLLIPAQLEPALLQQVREMAVQAFQAIDATGLARVDFLLDEVAQTLYVNEINTLPGFTRISMYPKLWEASGLTYPELVDRLVQLALQRHQDRQQNRIFR